MRTLHLAFAVPLALALSLTGPASAVPGDGEAAAPRLVGGHEVEPPGIYPFVVALVDRHTPDTWMGRFCEGSLVADQWVLTAARCLEDRRPADVDVVIGRHDLTIDTGVRLQASSFRIHPDHDGGDRFDAALVRLERPVQGYRTVIPAASTPAAGAAVVAGWGDTRGDARLPRALHEARVAMLPDTECAQSYGADFVPGSMVCAGDSVLGGVGACEADRGAPLFIVRNGGFLQVGIAGWSLGCAQPGYPGLYTSVTAVHAWVQATAGTGLLRCDGRAPTHLGTEGPDIIVGTERDDVIVSLAGRDVIDGRGGDDLICAGDGHDVVRGGPGHDTLQGGDGDDTLLGLDGDDEIVGGAGDDTLSGGIGNDRLDGGPGSNHLAGGPGRDALHGGDGEDVLIGHDGADLLRGGAGADLLLGGPDGDVLIGGGNDDIARGDGGDDIIRGNTGDDSLRGGPGDDVLRGNHGHDRLEGDGGDDTLTGGEGRDRISAGDGADSASGGPGNDVVNGGPGPDSLLGGDGADVLRGNGDADRMVGGDGDDLLEGGDGNDTLRGDGDDDRLSGGAGDDTIVGGTGEDAGDGGPGRDRCSVEMAQFCEPFGLIMG